MTRTRCYRIAASFSVMLLFFIHTAQAQKVLSDGISELASQIAAKSQAQGKKRIAVLPFTDLDGRSSTLGVFVAESLVTGLFNEPDLEIVERSMLDRVLSEIKLSNSGLVDPATAKRVGQVAGVDAVVTGTVTELATYVALNCRLIDVESGRVFAAVDAKIVKDDDLRLLLARAAPQPSDAADASPTVDRTKQSPTTKEVTLGKLTLTLQRCERAGALAECSFVARSSYDTSMRLTVNDGQCEFVDGSGNLTRGSVVTFSGNSQGRRPATGYPAVVLEPELPVKFRLSAIQLDSMAETFTAKLIIGVADATRRWSSGDSQTVLFRDIRIAK